MELFKIAIFTLNFGIFCGFFAGMLKTAIYNSYQLLFVSCWLERKFEIVDILSDISITAFFFSNSLIIAFSLGWI